MQTIDFDALANANRLIFNVALTPRMGARFQPTGFPSLGAATYQTREGTSLLVESAQSMANRLETTCWDDANQDLVPALKGLSHVRVERGKGFFTDSVLESHRLNSPYILESSYKEFVVELKGALGGLEEGPVNRKKLASALLKYDIGSLLHGIFLAKKDLAGGRLRIARALTAFVEADGVRVAASGGVKNDHVNPSGDTKIGFGNVPFARDEYTADRITLYLSLDLAQLRGYGLDAAATRLLTVLSLYKMRRLVDGDLRFRTACDLTPTSTTQVAQTPSGWSLPDQPTLEKAVKEAIAACANQMVVRTVPFDDILKKGSATEESGS